MDKLKLYLLSSQNIDPKNPSFRPDKADLVYDNWSKTHIKKRKLYRRCIRYLFYDEIDTETTISVFFSQGGGYTAKFGRTLRSTQKMIDKLKEEDWIDVFTRVIFAEFTLFNANSNLFVSAIVASEFMATGGMIHKFEFKVGTH